MIRVAVLKRLGSVDPSYRESIRTVAERKHSSILKPTRNHLNKANLRMFSPWDL